MGLIRREIGIGIERRISILKAAAFLLLIGPGVMMVVSPIAPTLVLIEAFLDFAFQPLDGGQKITGGAALLLNAILGGILVGFGALIWLVADRVFRHDQAAGRTILLVSIGSWFVCDSAGSVLAGAWFNAVINIAILAVFLTPLLWPAGD